MMASLVKDDVWVIPDYSLASIGQNGLVRTRWGSPYAAAIIKETLGGGKNRPGQTNVEIFQQRGRTALRRPLTLAG